jgi:hypothetical protein
LDNVGKSADFELYLSDSVGHHGHSAALAKQLCLPAR